MKYVEDDWLEFSRILETVLFAVESLPPRKINPFAHWPRKELPRLAKLSKQLGLKVTTPIGILGEDTLTIGTPDGHESHYKTVATLNADDPSNDGEEKTAVQLSTEAVQTASAIIRIWLRHADEQIKSGKDWITITEAAKRFGESKGTISRWATEGLIQAVAKGRARRVNVPSLEKYVKTKSDKAYDSDKPLLKDLH